FRRDEPWPRSRRAARVVLETDDGSVAVCFAAPVVELRRADAVTRPALALERLGPDLCRDDADLEEAVRRLAALPAGTELGVALLDQRVMAGVGNVFKSEVCFALRLNPGTMVDALERDVLTTVVAEAAAQLRANVDRPRRSTVAG